MSAGPSVTLDTPPRIWPGRLRVAAEMVVLFGALAFADWCWAGWSGFDSYQPSPLWIPVLVMALAYGTGAGLVAAAGASALWLLHGHRAIGERDYLDHLLHLSAPVLFWFVTAVVIGETTHVRAARERRHRRRAEASARNVARLGAAFEQLAETNRALQAAVARDEATTGHIVAAATGLTSIAPGEREAAIVDLVSVAAATRDFSIYRLRDGEGRAWLVGPEAQGRVATLPPTLRLALRGRTRPLTCARVADRDALASVGVIAAPLTGRDGGEPVACLVLHHLPFHEMNAYRMAELAELAAWLGPMLDEPLPAPRLAHPSRVA